MDRLREDWETELHRLATTWFPRTVDREHGGFLCDFDHRWRPAGAHLKLLEYQARSTLAAAHAAAHPRLGHLREVAAHGFRYLKERMWDHERGGWYRLLDRTGVPLEEATKHGHGTSYAISACVACHRLTGEPACLDLARRAFAWLEEHAHDDRYGGYFVFYERDGTPILSRGQGAARGATRDHIGTPIGFKDANTTADLLGAFTDLHRVWPDPGLRARLEELLAVVRDRLVVAPGVMHHFVHPDWTPLPDVVRYGQILHTVPHLLDASAALAGAVEPETARVATAMVDTLLEIAWDPERGGFHLAGSALGPAYLESVVVFEPFKAWWLQADGMRALRAMARLHPDEAVRYETHLVRLWEYVKGHLIDATHGGWLPAGLDTTPDAGGRPKATMWKDAAHEIEALLDCLAPVAAAR
jgi:mannobiose 2-epimerase